MFGRSYCFCGTLLPPDAAELEAHEVPPSLVEAMFPMTGAWPPTRGDNPKQYAHVSWRCVGEYAELDVAYEIGFCTEEAALAAYRDAVAATFTGIS